MKALAATVMTLAFFAMAAVTYLALRGDPMGGEPRVVVDVAPPAIGGAPATQAPTATPEPAPQASTSPPAGASVVVAQPQPSAASTGDDQQPPQPLTSVAPAPAAGTSDGSSDEDLAGVAVTVPK